MQICNVKAIDHEDYIIAGDGSFENPYVLKDDNNEIAQFIIQNYEEKTKIDNNSTLYANRLFTGSTQVDLEEIINNKGAHWCYTSGGQTTVYNGSLFFSLIEYVPNGLIDSLLADAADTNVMKVLIDIVTGGVGFANAKAALVAAGAAELTITGALLPIVCFSAASYGVLSQMEVLNNTLKNKIAKDARDNGHHLMIVHYKTSYNGAWYIHSTTEESLYYSHPQIPKSYYGEGVFRNYPRLG